MHLSKVLAPLATGAELARELARGIKNGELRLFLQGQVAADGEVSAAEALVRWAHPQNGTLAPAAFIPLAHFRQHQSSTPSRARLRTNSRRCSWPVSSRPLAIDARDYRKPF